MDEIDKLLEGVAPLLRAMKAPPEKTSPEMVKILNKALFGDEPARVLSEREMEIRILQILSRGRADGVAITDELAEENVRLDVPGKGVIYAFLDRMEARGLVESQWNLEMKIKTYRVAARGEQLLVQNRSTQHGTDAVPESA